MYFAFSLCIDEVSLDKLHMSAQSSPFSFYKDKRSTGGLQYFSGMVNSVSWLLLCTEGPNPIHLIESIRNIQAFLHYPLIAIRLCRYFARIVNVGERFTRRDIIVAAVQGRR